MHRDEAGLPAHSAAVHVSIPESLLPTVQFGIMNTYVILMRGINVGGKNKIPMKSLKPCLEELGFERVVTLIQSGNVILRSSLDAEATAKRIETALPETFKLDSSVVRVLALDHETFATVVRQAPDEFGQDDATFRYYVLFMMGVSPGEAMEDIEVRQGIDAAWQGDAAIYYRLPSLANPNATRSYLSKLTQKPVYQSITMRNWRTTTKLLELLEEHGRQSEKHEDHARQP